MIGNWLLEVMGEIIYNKDMWSWVCGEMSCLCKRQKFALNSSGAISYS